MLDSSIVDSLKINQIANVWARNLFAQCCDAVMMQELTNIRAKGQRYYILETETAMVPCIERRAAVRTPKMEADAALAMRFVAKVYTGRDGKCMCGCAGRYSYASAHRDSMSKERGYEVTDDEVSDRRVKKAVKRLLRNPGARLEDDHVWAVEGGSMVVAYFAPVQA